MSVKNVIRHIIDHHNQAGDDSHHQYWHQKLETIDSNAARQIIKQLDHGQHHERHHIGDCYRKNGMKIDLNRKSDEATNILKVMNFIVGGLTKDDGREDRAVDINTKLFLDQQAPEGGIVDEYGSELLQYQQIYGTKGKKSRGFSEMELLEEVNIRAIAVSILAETNGSAKIAQDILSAAGLKIIKKMDIGELQHLRSDLQSISTQTDTDTEHAR